MCVSNHTWTKVYGLVQRFAWSTRETSGHRSRQYYGLLQPATRNDGDLVQPGCMCMCTLHACFVLWAKLHACTRKTSVPFLFFWHHILVVLIVITFNQLNQPVLGGFTLNDLLDHNPGSRESSLLPPAICLYFYCANVLASLCSSVVIEICQHAVFHPFHAHYERTMGRVHSSIVKLHLYGVE